MRRFLPSLSDLRAFESAARHLSFTRAADELGVTQSAVSRNIANLEQFLSTPLFDRAGTRLVLTELGASYYADVWQVLERLEEISIDVVRGRRARVSLHIWASTSVAARVLIPRLPSFLARHPEIPVEVRALGEQGRFEPDEVDLALVRGAGSWKGCRAQELFTERLVVVCAPSFAAAVADPGHFDFSSLPALQNGSRASLWLTWLRLAEIRHSGPIQGQRFENSEMLIAGARHGLGFAVMPEHYVSQDLAEGRLVAPFGKPVESGEGYWLVIPERKWHDPRTQSFRRWVLTGRRLVPDAYEGTRAVNSGDRAGA